MKWVRGKFGNINATGKPQSGALILKKSHRQFWSAIEPGVRPLVKAFVGKGYDTFSSCEGHRYSAGNEAYRMVDIIIDRSEAPFWSECVSQINVKYGFDIDCWAVAEDQISVAMTRPCLDPVRFVFLIGILSDADLQRKTDVLRRFFLKIPHRKSLSKAKQTRSKA